MKFKLEMILIIIILLIDVYLYNINFGVNKKTESTEEYVTIYNIIPPRINLEEKINSMIVYDNMTLEELSKKINKSLKSTISGKGYLIASYSLKKGVDPYLATAIILEETGCNWECSSLVNTCNNVGGQKGSGCGSYSLFPTLDDGIKAFIDNLSKNYINQGLNTPELMNYKYAASTSWAVKINRYINTIKAQ